MHAKIVGGISGFCDSGDAVDSDFDVVANILSFALVSKSGVHLTALCGIPGANQVAAATFAEISTSFPPLQAILARVAVLRAINQRARYALPWMSVPRKDLPFWEDFLVTVVRLNELVYRRDEDTLGAPILQDLPGSQRS
jgi:hypothetical protein